MNRKKSILISFLIILSYLAVTAIFNFDIWHFFLFPKGTNNLIAFGEWPIYEFVAEQVRLNILAGRNPFSPIYSVLHPFGWDFAFDDMAPINGLYFLLLRPFFSIHNTFSIIVLVSLFLNNFIMFLLLKRLHISTNIAFIMGLVYGYTPFVALRIGHPTYIALYIFPLWTLSCLLFLTSRTWWRKLSFSFGIGVLFAIIILTNLYFALMIAILSLLLFLFYLFSKTYKKKFPPSFVIPYLVGTAIFNIIVLSPLYPNLYEQFIFNRYARTSSLTDSIAFSAHPLGIAIPSYVHPVIGKFTEYMSSVILHFPANFENFTYVGIIILGAYYYVIFYRKNINKQTLVFCKPFLLGSIFFYVLTLGPYLQMFGKILPIPLPYILLSFVPYIDMARAPGRFIVPFVFLSTILAAVLSDNFFRRQKSYIIKRLFFFILLVLFFLDQSYTLSFSDEVKSVPYELYTELRKKPQGTLLEIPFLIRDGLRSFGEYHSIWFPLRQMLHGHRIFSLYGGRIHEGRFQFYMNDSLIGEIGRAIEHPENIQTEKKLDYVAMKDSAELLSIEHILLKGNEPYSDHIRNIINQLGFQKTQTEAEFELYQKRLAGKEFLHVKLGEANDRLYLRRGWEEREKDGRWVKDTIGSVLFKVANPRSFRLQFSAFSYAKPQVVTVYMNSHEIGTVYLLPFNNLYSLYIDEKYVSSDINFVTFRFSNSIAPSQIDPKSQDQRNLAAFFQEIKLDDSPFLPGPEDKGIQNPSIDFTSNDIDRFLLQGWSNSPDDQARWVEEKAAKVMLKIPAKNFSRLTLSAHSPIKSQIVDVVMNDLSIGKLTIGPTNFAEYSLDTKKSLKEGINILTLTFSQFAKPSDIGGDPNDQRQLFLYVKQIRLD